MPVIALVLGLILIVQGVLAYVTAQQPDPAKAVSMTTLIPAFLGAPILLCGLLAMKHGMRKHAMHAAVTFGLIGALMGWGRGLSVIATKGFDPSSTAQLNVLFMAVICTVFVILCVQSFIAARKRQSAAKAEKPGV